MTQTCKFTNPFEQSGLVVDPISVYQMGKVGSESIVHSLEHIGLSSSVHHTLPRAARTDTTSSRLAGQLQSSAGMRLHCAVNLLEVQPFVDLIISGGYLTQADINQDGEVNLMDVGPIVELLTGK